jgi:hypothetical protein
MPFPRGQKPEEALEAFLDDARAGCSDQWLAEQTDLSVRQVQLWRKSRGLSSDKGPIQQTVDALSGLTVSYEPAQHMSESSILFEGPKYVMREALDYTQYARMCFVLTESYAFSLRQICHATGTRIGDVNPASKMARRHLGLHGRAVLGCTEGVVRCLDGACRSAAARASAAVLRSTPSSCASRQPTRIEPETHASLCP